jgi:polyisoprenoid-binding protein YceI
MAPIVAAPCEAANYIFEQRRTQVRFACSIGLGTQRGRFTHVEGSVEYDPAVPDQTKVAARVATGSLTTGDAMMDDTLKGSDFFNVRSFPRMSFISRSVHAAAGKTAVMKGDMTVNGITRPVRFNVVFRSRKGGAPTFVARTRIKRSAFNMTAFQSMAGDDVDIEIDAALRQK